MRIVEFQITNYRPLKPTDKIRLKNFDLFYGKNEYGKTLLIDSLVKILLSGDSQSFHAIDRVNEFPEGYGYVEDKDGILWKLPEKGNLTNLSELTPTELRNVFIIRNSDLTIPEGEEFTFYRNITERLTGLRTPMIRSTKERLKEIGNLTQPSSDATLSGTVGSGRLKPRVKQAGNLVRQISELVARAETENFDELEEQISEITETENAVGREMQSLEDASKREKYEEGMRALESLAKTEEGLEQLKVFNDDDLQSWREAERDRTRYGKQHERLLSKLAETKARFEQKKGIHEEKSREFKHLSERKRIIDETIRPRLGNCEVKSKELVSLQPKEKFVEIAFIVFFILLAISLIGLVASQIPLFTFSSVLFFVLVLLSSAFKMLSLRKRGSVAALWQEIRLEASRFELEADDIEKVLAKIQIFDESYSKSQETITDLGTGVGVLAHEVSRLADEELPSLEKALREVEDRTSGLKTRSKVENLQSYAKNLGTRQQQERMMDRLAGILKSHFGEKSKKASAEENVEYWEKKIAELESYKDKSKDIKYSEKRVSDLKEKNQAIKQQKEEVQEKLAEFRNELQEISRELNVNVRPLASPLLCETLVDLREISKILQEFIANVNDNTSTVIEVMKIFEAMEGEEEQKVEQLFGENSPVSSYFREITDGLYQKVEYISEEEKIRATMKTGEILDADKLSGGAYDQLYLSIRLALGEKLLKGEKGFFIMDDPFIKADVDRLAKQLHVLKRISKDGWQILYFTAKEEVKDALKDDVANRSIGYHEIEGIFS